METWLNIHEELPMRKNMHFFLQWWTPMNPKSQVGARNAHVQSKQQQEYVNLLKSVRKHPSLGLNSAKDACTDALARHVWEWVWRDFCSYCLVVCTWASPGHHYIHAAEDECMHETERERRQVHSREPVREKTMPMRTYAFCVLQTFHRLCKTSESVRPLESWEEGREGGRKGGRGQVNWQVRFQGKSSLPPISPETISKRVGRCRLVQFSPKSSTHVITITKKLELNWHQHQFFMIYFIWVVGAI